MSKRTILAGTASVSVPIFVADSSSTTSGGLGSLVYNTASLVAEYRRKGDSSWTAISLVTKTLGTWVSGGFIADGAEVGAYELDLPNAAIATGVPWVIVRLRGAANMVSVLIEIELTTIDNQYSGGLAPLLLDFADAVESGLTVRQALRLSLAALAGKSTVVGNTVTFRNAVADSKNRVVATMSGKDRSSITYDVS